MKSIYMIFSKLRSMFATEKLFFVVFCIGILTCNIMFTYMYGLIMQLNERDGVADVYLYYVQGERMDIDDMEKSCYKYSCECDYYVVMCFCGYRVTSTGVKRTKGYEIVELG